MVTQGCHVPLRRVILFSCSATCDVGVCLVAQLCPTPGDPMTLLPVGILQARILEWVAVPASRDLPRPRDQTQVSCTAGRCFTRDAQEYWRGLPAPAQESSLH